MVCPYCGNQNIAGVNNCDECMQDLTIFDVPHPTGGLQKHLMEDTVSKMKFDRLVIVKPTDTLAHAVSRIKSIGIGQALVVDNGKLVGILTEFDLLEKIACRAVDLNQVTVSSVMTVEPDVVEEREPIRIIINKMVVGGYRHVPIVRQGQPIGIISAHAIAKYILKYSELELREGGL